jgi:CHAD domain-containing protein
VSEQSTLPPVRRLKLPAMTMNSLFPVEEGRTVNEKGTQKRQEKEKFLRQFFAGQLFLHFKPFVKQVKKAAKGKHNRGRIHELRVSCRKLRVILRNYQKLFSPAEFAIMEKSLRVLASDLALLRELDVLQKALGKISRASYTERAVRGFDRLKSVCGAAAAKRRASISGKLEMFLQSPGYQLLKKSAVEFDSSADLLTLCQHPVVIKNAESVIRKWLRLITAYLDHVHEPDEEFHELRIQLKSFRYTLQDFDCLWEGRFSSQIERITYLQDLMGEIHDHQVWVVQLDEILAVITEQSDGVSVEAEDAVFAAQLLKSSWTQEINEAFAEFQVSWLHLQNAGFWESLSRVSN